MLEKMKLKDILLIALLTSVYMVIYMTVMVVITPLGPFGHAISPGICGLVAGIVLYFMAKKVNKRWQFTLFTVLVMGVFTLMGGGYLPWLISSITMAILADLLVMRGKGVRLFRIAMASALMHLGQAWGAIIPSLFFVESYREEWIQRGQTAQDMDHMIQYTAGVWGLISSVIVFVLAFAGVYLGYAVLKDHLKE